MYYRDTRLTVKPQEEDILADTARLTVVVLSYILRLYYRDTRRPAKPQEEDI